MYRSTQTPASQSPSQDPSATTPAVGQQTLAQGLPAAAPRTIRVGGRNRAAVPRLLTELTERQLNQLCSDSAEELAAAGFELDGLDLATLRVEAQQVLQGRPQPAARGFNMANRTDADTGMNFLLAAAQPDLQMLSGIGEGFGGPVDSHATFFNPESRNPAPRADLGRVAAQHAGLPGRLPATQAAAAIHPELSAQEYLHRQGHGLGGSDTADNIASGSARANTEMIPVESAVAGRGDLIMAVTFQQEAGTVLIHRIQMRVYNQETGQVVFEHHVDGQSRVFTRTQYDQLGARATAALAPEVIEVRAEYPHLDGNEAHALIALLELSRS